MNTVLNCLFRMVWENIIKTYFWQTLSRFSSSKAKTLQLTPSEEYSLTLGVVNGPRK